MDRALRVFILTKRIAGLLCRLIYRAGTQKMRVLPNFFVIGPPRSGTSSLNHYIGQHPCFLKPFMKELGYSRDRGSQKAPHGHFMQNLYRHVPGPLRRPLIWVVQGLYYQGGAAGYRKLFPVASAMRRVERELGKAVTGDFTVFGLYDNATTEGFPYCLASDRAKFITILRNPVDFLFSFYLREINAYFREVNREVSFDRFIHHPGDLYTNDKVTRRWESVLQEWRPLFEQYPFFDESRFSFATFMVSYVVFIRQWARNIPDDRFLVLSFTDLCEQPRDTMNTVFNFLELPSFEVPDITSVNANVYADKAIPQETASYIREMCKPYNEELYEFLGRDLGWG